MKKLALLIPFVLLTGCTNYKKNILMHIEYNQSGALIEATPADMYQFGVTDSIDSVFYVGMESCSTCKKLHADLTKWCEKNKGAIYYIPFETINNENLHYITDATEGPFKWEDNQTLPVVYFFSKGSVLVSTNEKNTIKTLNNNVSVNSPE